MESAEPEQEDVESEAAVCRVSTWFYRRMGMLILLTGGLGLFFLYDGKIGYPKKNFTVSLYESFEAGQDGTPFDRAAFANENLSGEQLSELEKAHLAGQEGATWAGFAADRMLPEKVPERYSAADIEEQFRFAIIMGVIALAIFLFCLWQRTRVYRYDSEKVSLPNGEVHPFSAFRHLDLSKWDRGIARITSRAAEGSEEKSLRFDDYKYSGIGALLLRVCEVCPDLEIEGDRRWLEATALEKGQGEAAADAGGETDSKDESEEKPT